MRSLSIPGHNAGSGGSHASAGSTISTSTSKPPAGGASSAAAFAHNAAGWEVVVEDTLKVAEIINRFRARGHLVAQLDPLCRPKGGPWLGPIGDEFHRSDHSLLDLITNYPAAAPPEQRSEYVAQQLRLQGPGAAGARFCVGEVMPGGRRRHWALHEVVEVLRDTYCGTLAIEYKHLFHQDEMAWMEARFEERRPLDWRVRARALQHLLQADALERFLAARFPASKRFGLEGCEALLPGLRAMVERCALEGGVQRIEIGMAHRGRLNLLANLLGKPLGALCTEMEGRQSDFAVGDVKYHLGQSGWLEVGGGATGHPARQVRLSIAPNPSHLEAVAPVVLGMVRAEQAQLRRDPGGGGGADAARRVMGLLVHGDAAFAGLGCVAECLQLMDVPGFSTGGSIHVVINNQVGFTTMPSHARSSPHPTGVLKMVGAPILHVNADDTDAVVEAFIIAADWRARWSKDVVVDLVGYRRNGHNELDDPSVALPLTHQRIQVHPSVLPMYADKLLREGVVSPQQLAEWEAQVAEACEEEWAAAQAGAYRESAKQFLVSSWQGDALASLASTSRADCIGQEPTGLPLATLQRVGTAICQEPPGFALHADVAALLQARRRMVADGGSRVNWAMAEALAFGTLMLFRAGNGMTAPEACGACAGSPSAGDPPAQLGVGLNRGHYDVRLSGQDVERGTFAQRHAVVWDQVSGARCVLLNSIAPGRQDELEVWNSPLSEAAVLGYEYGYSLGTTERSLVIWEAQFGDFANNAQVVIDQFIASGMEKWGQASGLVLLLPHGYDGQGPDHSSGRIERFLQLCRDDPDHLPGYAPSHERLMTQTFEEVAKDSGGKLFRQQVLDLLSSVGAMRDRDDGRSAELLELLWAEMGLPEGMPVNRTAWRRFMRQYLRRDAEHDANMFVANITTPAQYFHVLRRQVNLPHKAKKPLVLFTPKYLLHHKPATSALADFTTGNFFRRVIADGKPGADNLRHTLLGGNGDGECWLLPAERIRRVILCSGQIFYALHRARCARKLRDVVLVRLEQVSPFPHDLLLQVIAQYRSADLVWVQEEPKNMGAWTYVEPRLQTALRHAAGVDEYETPARLAAAAAQRVPVRYVGRPPASSPATASFAIHQKETQEIIEAAFTQN